MKLHNQFSTQRDILFGVPQVSTLEPLLSKIYVSDMLPFNHNTNFTSYAEDNTPDCLG